MQIYSVRNQKVPDVYAYDAVPERLKGQLAHIANDLFAMCGFGEANDIFQFLIREWGIPDQRRSMESGKATLIDIISNPRCPVHQTFDILEAAIFKLIERGDKRQLPFLDNLLDEMNEKFSRAGFGYRFDNGMMMRVDSQLAHKEIVLPALGILSDPAYSVADSEYRSAHEHFRHGRYAECLVDCCKAFESVMKVICKKKYRVDKSTETVGKLVAFLNSKGFFPAFMGEHFNQFSGMLTSTVNTVRNKMGGHGAGVSPVKVPEEYAAFALHSTAADILLLAKLAK